MWLMIFEFDTVEFLHPVKNDLSLPFGSNNIPILNSIKQQFQRTKNIAVWLVDEQSILNYVLPGKHDDTSTLLQNSKSASRND